MRLLYAGNIGAKQDLLAFCRFIADSGADLVFEIHGSGGGAAEVERFVAERGDPRLRYGPFLPLEQFAARLRQADLYVVTERSGVGGSFFPSKLMSAFAAGIPVLAVSDPDSPLGVEMREVGPGLHVTWRDLDRLADVLLNLRPGDSRLAAWSERALQRAGSYDRAVLIDRIAAMLDSLIEGGERQNQS